MEQEEFDAFYTGSFHRLVGQLHALVGDRSEAQDCVQEAFIRAWSHRGSLEPGRSPEAWVRTTAYRLAVSRWRRAQRLRQPDRALQQQAGPDGPTEDRLALVEALRRLPEPQRRALVLHHLCDLSVRAVADETGVPEGTVKARLARGRAALQQLLSPPAEQPTSGLAEGATGA